MPAPFSLSFIFLNLVFEDFQSDISVNIRIHEKAIPFSNDKFGEEYRTASGSLSQTPEVKN